MSENEKNFLMAMAKNNEESLRVISKDMNNLARMLKKTDYEEEDKFKANLVQSSFYLNAYNLATRSFNKMIAEKEENPECDKDLVDYFMDLIVEMQDMKLKREMEDKSDGNEN